MFISFNNSIIQEVYNNKQDEIEWTNISIVTNFFIFIGVVAMVFGQRDLLSKLLIKLDRNIISVLCPSLSYREKTLKWACSRLPHTWKTKCFSIEIFELWRDGSLLCTLINSEIPGACANPHRHWRKPPVHAQTIAYKYLGVNPLFTDNQLNGELSMNLEQNFIYYLRQLQLAINKWHQDETGRKFSSAYVARGMGLYIGEQHRKTIFYIYSNIPIKKPNNVLMFIRGPYGAQANVTIPFFFDIKPISLPINILEQQFKETNELLFQPRKKEPTRKSIFTKISATFSAKRNFLNLRNNNSIPLQIQQENERFKVIYIPKTYGIYEINFLCGGEYLLKGCPFYVYISKNTSGICDCFDNKNKNLHLSKKKKKVVSAFIDCIDEKITIENFNSKLEIHKLAYLRNDNGNNKQDNNNDDDKEYQINNNNEMIVTNIMKSINEKHIEKQDLSDSNIKPQQMIIKYENISTHSKYLLKLNNNIETKVDINNNMEKIKQPSKELKNIINKSNKKQIMEYHLPPDLNKKPENINKSALFMNNPKDIAFTSPICPVQIVPEVDSRLKNLDLSNKRKLVTEQKNHKNDSMEKSLFSYPIKNKNKKFDHELKNNDLNGNSYYLENNYNANAFKEKRNFWEKLSLYNCTTDKKFYNLNCEPGQFSTKRFFQKFQHGSNNKIKTDKILIKEKQIFEKKSPQLIQSTNIYKKSNKSEVVTLKDQEKFFPIFEKENFFDESNKVPLNKLINNNQYNENFKINTNSSSNIINKRNFKLNFQHSIKYFQNLEDNHYINKMKFKKITRRLSLDGGTLIKDNLNKMKKSNSLNLIEKFSINNLYNNVFSEQNWAL